MSEPSRPDPDDKDWTWVLDRPCPDCGFDAIAVELDEVPSTLFGLAGRWITVLQRPDVAVRPTESIWSPLEYAAHCSDVCQIFGDRAVLMIREDDPQFDNWDQDATAIEKRYWEADPAVLAGDLMESFGFAAGVFGGVSGGAWGRQGRRSNGSRFTVATLASYFLHDIVHHLHDVHG